MLVTKFFTNVICYKVKNLQCFLNENNGSLLGTWYCSPLFEMPRIIYEAFLTIAVFSNVCNFMVYFPLCFYWFSNRSQAGSVHISFLCSCEPFDSNNLHIAIRTKLATLANRIRIRNIDCSHFPHPLDYIFIFHLGQAPLIKKAGWHGKIYLKYVTNRRQPNED